MKFEAVNTSNPSIVIPQQRVMGNMHGREDAISTLRCISEAAGGCEREISEAEYYQWDTATKAEYGQSGWCLGCQNKIFADPDNGCFCDWIDVGLPVMMPSWQNEFCPEHGDPDFYVTDFNYDPDLREDEPPADLHLVKWSEAVLQ